MGKDINKVRDFRNEVIQFLKFVSNEGKSPAFSELSIHDSELPERLCHLWFDEIYIPGISYFDDLKGDNCIQNIEHFSVAFTADELESIDRFNRFFELRVGIRRKTAKGLKELATLQFWNYVSKDARAALLAFKENQGELT